MFEMYKGYAIEVCDRKATIPYCGYEIDFPSVDDAKSFVDDMEELSMIYLQK